MPGCSVASVRGQRAEWPASSATGAGAVCRHLSAAGGQVCKMHHQNATAHHDTAPREPQQRLGVPVIDGVSATVKLAEALVGLGMKTGKWGDYEPPLAKPWVGWASGLGSVGLG